MQQARVPRLLLGVAVMVATLTGILPPLFYMMHEWAKLRSEVEGSLRIQALAITRVVNRHPETWRFQENLLSELLAFSLHPLPEQDMVRIASLDGETILRHGSMPPAPVFAGRAEIMDSGRVVAYIEDVNSLRPLILRTLGVAGGGVVLALAVYLTLLRLPLRAVAQAIGQANAAADSARQALAGRAAAQERLRLLNDELELRVAERTRELEGAVGALRRRNHEAAQLGELSELLQTCGSLGEAGEIVSRFCAQLFRGAGAAYLLTASRARLERIAAWGEPAPAEQLMPEDCWALRRGRVHHAQESGIALACAHARPEAAQALCVPLNAQGTALGVLYLEEGAPEESFARLLGERLSLAIANLQLREALRDQSIRDALTGLFNRRYLEESLERELSRARRTQRPLAVFMLDVDHFKNYNDRFGHDGGDAALRALGRLLKGACRASDLACRFGGEEFTVALPDTDAAAAAAWAERLMADVRALKVKSGERALEGITISMGLAAYPENGADAETLLQTADVALYEAKHAGRDRLALAPSLRPPMKEVNA